VTRLVAAVLTAAVCAVLAGCGEEKAAPAPAGPTPAASDLFDKKAAPRKAKGKADPG
jgi:hypothetical protein